MTVRSIRGRRGAVVLVALMMSLPLAACGGDGGQEYRAWENTEDMAAAMAAAGTGCAEAVPGGHEDLAWTGSVSYMGCEWPIPSNPGSLTELWLMVNESESSRVLAVGMWLAYSCEEGPASAARTYAYGPAWAVLDMGEEVASEPADMEQLASVLGGVANDASCARLSGFWETTREADEDIDIPALQAVLAEKVEFPDAPTRTTIP